MDPVNIISPDEEAQIRAEVRRELAERQAREQQRRAEQLQREQEKARAKEMDHIRIDEEKRLRSAAQPQSTAKDASGNKAGREGSQRPRRRQHHHNRFTLNMLHVREIVFAAFFLTALALLYFFYKN